MAYRINGPLRSLMVDVVTARLSGTNGTAGTQGMLRIYSGAAPATADEAPGANNVLLVSIASNAAGTGINWSSGTNGTAVASRAQYLGTAATSGIAQWGRLSGTDGTGYVVQGDVGTSATSAFIINSVTIAALSVVSMNSMTMIQDG
jgi:hypothetical protein